MPVIVPESLESALAALTDHPNATVLAGGTDLMVEVNDGRRSLERVVAVGRVPELAGIRVDAATVVIGAATTFAQSHSSDSPLTAANRVARRPKRGLARRSRSSSC